MNIKNKGLYISWSVHESQMAPPGGDVLFICGFAAALILLASLIVLARIFSNKKYYSMGKKYWIGAACGGILAAFAVCLFSLLPPENSVKGLGASLLMITGMLLFQISLFQSACSVLFRKAELKYTVLALFAAGLLLFLAYLFKFPSAAYAMTAFSFFMFLASIFSSILRKDQRMPFIFLSVLYALCAAAFIIPLFPLSLLLLSAAMTAGLICGYSIFPPRIAISELEKPSEKETGKGENAGSGEDGEYSEAAGRNDWISQALNPFIPQEFLTILQKPSVMDLQLGDHVKQEMTIFFSDIRRFTDLSEHLTPEESFRFINSYLSRIVPVIRENNGFVDKYMGDAILALYPSHNGADQAVKSSIEIQKRIVEYNEHRAKCGYRSLSMGIGLHTGTLMLGVVGVEGRMQNTVISDAVNLASRLESITKVFNISLAISEETFKNLEDPGSYMYRFIGKVRVKGKAEPVSVFEIFDGLNESLMERKMKANMYFEQGMINYYQKKFSEALLNFRKVLEILPEDGASIFYMDNCMAKVNVTH